MRLWRAPRLAALSREVADLRNQLEAIGGILRVLSGSEMGLQPILYQIVEAAARLGHADSALVWLTDGELLQFAS